MTLKEVVHEVLETALDRAIEKANANLPEGADPDNWGWLSQQDRIQRVATEAAQLAQIKLGRSIDGAHELALEIVEQESYI